MSQRETIAKLECLTGWVVLTRLSTEFELRVWSKDNGEDIEHFELSDEGSRAAVDRYEIRCREIVREMRP